MCSSHAFCVANHGPSQSMLHPSICSTGRQRYSPVAFGSSSAYQKFVFGRPPEREVVIALSLSSGLRDGLAEDPVDLGRVHELAPVPLEPLDAAELVGDLAPALEGLVEHVAEVVGGRAVAGLGVDVLDEVCVLGA